MTVVKCTCYVLKSLALAQSLFRSLACTKGANESSCVELEGLTPSRTKLPRCSPTGNIDYLEMNALTPKLTIKGFYMRWARVQEPPKRSLNYKASHPKSKAKSNSQASRGKANRDKKKRLPSNEKEFKGDILKSIERAVAAGPSTKLINHEASEFHLTWPMSRMNPTGQKC